MSRFSLAREGRRPRPSDELPTATRWRRRLWPVPVAILVACGYASVRAPFETPSGTLVAIDVPLLLAIVVAGIVIGGRRGLVIGGVLLALAAYWAWWFAWGLDDNISPFSMYMALSGLADGAAYVAELLYDLWPLVLVAALVVGGVAARRGARVWSALCLLPLVLLLASFPYRASWSDSCNDLSGPAPLITAPIAQPLMDAGIGVLPSGSETLVGCSSTGDREWMPFWKGDDHLPPGPGLYGMNRMISAYFPRHLHRDPAPLPGKRLGHVIVLSWPARDEFDVLIETPEPLGSGPPQTYPLFEFRIEGHRQDDGNASEDRGTHGWCYSPVWVGLKRFRHHAAGDRVRVDFVYRGRTLASGYARIKALGPNEDRSNELVRRMGAPLGCPPLW